MIEKIYMSLWFLLAFAAVLFYVTGMMTPKAAVAFGFIFFAIVFMGIIGILPEWVAHQSKEKH